MAASCRHLKELRAEFVAWNANVLLNLYRALGRYGPITVFQATRSGLCNAHQFAHLSTRKTPFLAVFPQKLVRFTHNDTYGIDASRPKSIPIVSDGGA